MENKRVTRAVAIAGTGLAALGLVALSAHSLWFDVGPWTTLPDESAPERSALHESLYADAARGASAALARHRQEHGFPAITAAVAVGGEVVWTGSAG